MSYNMSGWIYLILGSLAIALGGFLTTKGWNHFNNYSEKKSLINGAFLEWRQNEIYLKYMEEHLSNIDKITKPLVMSTFHYDVIQDVLTSHLFDRKCDKDNSLLHAVSSYLLNIKPVNGSITKINNIVSSEIDSTKKNEALKNFYTSSLLDRFIKKHKSLGEELKLLNK